MDIDKICRCCMALSGPLLSIYDGASAGSGCVADMLRDIAKLKPQQNDNMPEKVCLSCISEINRCYVFKMKCENSNRTLRQLLPEALKEYFDDTVPKVVKLTDASMQTDEKLTNSTQVQTLPLEMPVMVHRDVQTIPELSELPSNEDIDPVHTSVLKREPSAENISPKCKKRKQNLKRTLYDDTSKESGKEVVETNEVPSTYILLEAVHIDSNASEEQALIIQHVTQHEQVYKSEENCNSEYHDSVDVENIESSPRNVSNIQESDFTCDLANEPFDEKYTEKDEKVQEQIVTGNLLILKNDDEVEDNRSNMSLIKRSTTQRREQYKCSFCIMTFFSLKVLRRHLSKRHNIVDTDIYVDEVPVSIDIVDEGSQSQDSINDQVELTMENVPNPRLLPRSRVTTKPDKQVHTQFKYFCEYCMAGFAQRKALTYHMKQKICMTNNFKCNICERIFISEKSLEAHKETHNSQYSCLECNKECGTIEQLSEHMIEEHNRNARNQCHICKKVFTMRASLMDHLRIHSGEKPFVCTVCGKRFAQNSNMRQHLMRHTNEKNFKCDMCPNAYVTKAELFSHKRTHTGDHPFKCDVCSTSFTSSSSLLKHKRKHTGERPYVCEYCPMRFASLNVLKNHQRTHTGEKPYKCTFCDKCFTQKGDCLLHQRTHGLGEVICFCGSKFSKMSNLRQHLKLKHPNMTDEKRKELDDAISRQRCNQEGIEYQITLKAEEEDETGHDKEASHYITIENAGDDSASMSQSNIDEVSNIIMEADILME